MHRPNSTLTQLTYAVAVDRHRNFRKAAKACFVTQPTLSMQLQKLEDALGVVLFDRSRKPVAPTAEGEVLLEQFRVVLREHAQIDELLQQLRGVVAGSYRLGIIPTMAPTVLPALIPPFISAFPEVELHVEELTTDEIIRRLEEETLDGGILATPLNHPKLTEYPIVDEDFVVFHAPHAALPTTAQGRVQLEELPLEKLIVMRQGHCLRTQAMDLCALGEVASEKQRFTLEAGSLATLCRMVREGPFFTVLPSMAAEEMREQGHGELIKPIAEPIPFREIALVARRKESRRAVREALLSIATERLAQPKTERRLKPVKPL